ncbi:NADH:ubiquinone oxidoreductase subunit NDUFA12 [Histidinibacterium aquaticum]|uniref:NADH:ubiquinone oxidoreductase subunit NDUFA12 n=1 Tax=Histidinibacterium aquaticum TaxID=2613962 RepID=A0A5J5GCL2_9RHOB|nr:NADH:ubiquinone oxidoreductase subunit NDUFA12 [Histidinibacterium aquaticum]KAA9005643.1 NADH:ubiquinone oxidoreductase subunit NDUFA12 [Histidinibacterium aquaticum]
MGIGHNIKRLFTWWDGQTFNTQFFTWRNGEKVGEDDQGNLYYRNADDSKRWVIFNGEVEGSRIAPEWHGWLHRTWDEPPTEKPLKHQPWEKEHLPNLTGTDDAYAPIGSIRRPQPAPRSDYEAWTPE